MLEPLAEDLWTADRPMRFPGGVVLPVRMTVVRLPDGALWLHSPVKPDDELFASVERLGPVRHLVGPCLLHHLHLGAWHRRVPEAQLHGAPGLAAKRPDLPFAGELGDEAPASWRGAIDQLVIRGQPKLNEVVFLHRPSRTLIASDLAFNVTRPANWATSLVLRLMGTRGRLACSRAWRAATRDRAAARASLERMFGWDFDRLLVGHGDPVPSGAKPALAATLWWGLGRPRADQPLTANA